jgi:glycosyltransferase involved in cell wall biosynthesis
MERSRIGIVIPALNEAETVAHIVKAVSQYGLAIVVDDGSTDGTALRAREAGAVVVSYQENRGYDAALNAGFKMAEEIACEIIITVDADGQHDPLLVQKFVDLIQAGADVVIGIRSSRQRIAEHLFAFYTRFRFGIQDPLCGMKAYRTEVHKARGHFDSYGSIGTELMIFAAMRGYRCEQVSFNVRERKGKSRFGQALSGNFKIMRALLLSLYQVR